MIFYKGFFFKDIIYGASNLHIQFPLYSGNKLGKTQNERASRHCLSKFDRSVVVNLKPIFFLVFIAIGVFFI